MSVFPLKRPAIGEIKKIIVACWNLQTVGLKSDGTVVAVGRNHYGQCNVSDWRDIVAVACGNIQTVGLKSGGTVVAVGYNSDGRLNVSGWRDIVAVAGGPQHTVGLKSGGTVVAVGDNNDGQCNVSGWRDIVAVAGGSRHTVGLKSDGTVVAVGRKNDGQCNVSDWRDIVAVVGSTSHTVGLKSDGTVVAVGNNSDGRLNVSDWRDIVAVAGGPQHTVGLKSGGTVVAVGDNNYGQCNVSGWRDIVAVAGGLHHTVGLKSDGTVVAVGDNNDGQCNVSDWKLATYDRKGLLIAKEPLNLLEKTSVKGFNFEGIEPANTSRKLAFKVDDIWNKLDTSGALVPLTKTVDEGTANISDEDLTSDYVLENGNTVAELETITNVPAFAGKLIYPAVALYASSEAEVMPTFGMTVKAEIDTTVNVYSYTAYSQEYAISDGDDVPIVSVVAETETTGNGKVDITARIKENGEWSDYMSLNHVQMKTASALQLKAVYTVQSTDGRDSAKIKGVIIKYNTTGAVTSNSTTDIVTVTERFTNDLTYVHAYVKHKELADSEIKVYCSLRKTPSKRIMYQFGNGTGALKTFTLPDTGINQDTLLIYVDGKLVYDFGYNTETSEVTISADKDTVLSASYEYGWEKSEWIEMEQGVSQVNDSGAYTTEYAYTVPKHDGEYTVTAIKYELLRPEGHVDNEIIGVGTGKRQIIQLPHFARKETIVCNGKWSYDYDSKRLTIIAPEGEDIAISYDWIAESPQVYGVMAGWAD